MAFLRKLRFPLLLLLLTYIACEVASYAFLTVSSWPNGAASSLREIGERRRRLAGESPEDQPDRQPGGGTFAGADFSAVIHPYLGFVLDAEKSSEPVNPYGFRGAGEHFHTGPFDVTVVVTGGSGAEYLLGFSEDVLRDEIARIPRFECCAVHVVSLAVFAWKQPQQLMAVAYYLAQGGKIDLLINLDGHNEVANWTNQDRYAAGAMYPAYPSPGLWNGLTAGLAEPRYLGLAGQVFVVRGARRSLARAFESFSWSITASAFWSQIDRLLDHHITTLQSTVSGSRDRLAYFRTGPTGVVSPSEALEFSAKLWENGSRQLARLAEGNGFDYFHFLQTNIFVEGGKPLSAAERAFFPDESDRHFFWTRRGYPRLRALGEQLSSEGIYFRDLTKIFADVEDTLYIDNCCHFNKKGNDILARRIAAHVEEYYRDRPVLQR